MAFWNTRPRRGLCFAFLSPPAWGQRQIPSPGQRQPPSAEITSKASWTQPHQTDRGKPFLFKTPRLGTNIVGGEKEPEKHPSPFWALLTRGQHLSYYELGGEGGCSLKAAPCRGWPGLPRGRATEGGCSLDPAESRRLRGESSSCHPSDRQQLSGHMRSPRGQRRRS